MRTASLVRPSLKAWQPDSVVRAADGTVAGAILGPWVDAVIAGCAGATSRFRRSAAAVKKATTAITAASAVRRVAALGRACGDIACLSARRIASADWNLAAG